MDRADLAPAAPGCRAGGPAQAYEAKLEHMPMLGPVFDLRTIGAGGGSIAHVDDGFLKVGPESAGAVPGPSCYLRGGSDATTSRMMDGQTATSSASGSARTATISACSTPRNLSRRC